MIKGEEMEEEMEPLFLNFLNFKALRDKSLNSLLYFLCYNINIS